MSNPTCRERHLSAWSCSVSSNHSNSSQFVGHLFFLCLFIYSCCYRTASPSEADAPLCHVEPDWSGETSTLCGSGMFHPFVKIRANSWATSFFYCRYRTTSLNEAEASPCHVEPDWSGETSTLCGSGMFHPFVKIRANSWATSFFLIFCILLQLSNNVP
jgi:hypothetical protein